jgi:hypothetical protein
MALLGSALLLGCSGKVAGGDIGHESAGGGPGSGGAIVDARAPTANDAAATEPHDGASTFPNDATECAPSMPTVDQNLSLVDVYLMLDRSASQTSTLPDAGSDTWSATELAVTEFVEGGYTPGLEVGVQFFPIDDGPDLCTAAYDVPAVPFAPLPQNQGPIARAVAAAQPSGARPLGPALAGGITYLEQQLPSPPGAQKIVVLVTGGPSGACDSTDATDAARAGAANDPPTLTFVIGLGSPNDELDAIARAGGTDHAHYIDGVDSEHAFAQAMLEAIDIDPGCSFPLTASVGGSFDPSLVGFRFGHIGSNAWLEAPRVKNAADCAPNGGEGWYFDDPSAPMTLLLCPGTCNEMLGSTAFVAYGCPPKLGR